ncbi:2291_t:CDS:2 [Entrophospora sp. SA101]|nr:2291_t:CDS:2 [Entrophospora sp. SA101]CAJ0842469.1 10097_t:CDS:2 [Entrophospora sp. SA101]
MTSELEVFISDLIHDINEYDEILKDADIREISESSFDDQEIFVTIVRRKKIMSKKKVKVSDSGSNKSNSNENHVISVVVEHHVVEGLQTIDEEEGGGGGENQDDISEGGQRYTTHWATKWTKEETSIL